MQDFILFYIFLDWEGGESLSKKKHPKKNQKKKNLESKIGFWNCVNKATLIKPH